MIIEEKLKNIIEQLRASGESPLYIRTALKEYLQSYVLNYIFSESKYSDVFVFTGGTCLRKVYKINRLSEDLDFDLKNDIDIPQFAVDLQKYFESRYMFKDFSVSIRQQGRQILLKFDLLYKLGLVGGNDSPLLYVKLDVTKMESSFYGIETKLLTDYDFNYIAKYYDISTLMAGKIMAVLERTRLWGADNKEVIKGRDYFDLLWYLDQKIIPNIKRTNDLLLKGKSIEKELSLAEIMTKVDKKVETATTRNKEDFKRDLTPFISNPSVVDGYVESYLQNYNKAKQYLLS